MGKAIVAYMNRKQKGGVRNWLRRGKLRAAERVGNVWRIPALLTPPRVRGYQRASYSWKKELVDLHEEFRYINDYRSLVIEQDDTDKKQYKIYLYTTSSVNATRTVRMGAIERERLELMLIFDSAVVGQMNSKYSDPVYLQTATYDSILEDVTCEYIDAAKRLGQTDDRIIACELMEVTNHALRALRLSKGNNDIKALKCLSPVQIGEVLIRIHNVVKLSLDDTDDESERATVLAAYMESGTREGLYYYDVSNTEIRKLISRYSFSAKKSDQSEVVNYLQIHAPLRKTNSDGDLIAVSNGIFDFKNKVLMSFSPDYVFLRKLKVEYNAGAVNVVIHNDDDGTGIVKV